MNIKLIPEHLTKDNFKAFGEVITTQNSDSIIINEGYAQKFYEQCTMDANEKNGKSTLHIYVAKKREFPLHVHMMEKHPYFSQTFMPRSKEPFLVVVCLGEDKPDLSTIKVFKTDGEQGVFYKRGIWHFPLISLKDDEQFIVIDRSDEGKSEKKLVDCIEFDIKDKNIFVLEKKQ